MSRKSLIFFGLGWAVTSVLAIWLHRGSLDVSLDDAVRLAVSTASGLLGAWLASDRRHHEPYNPWDENGNLKQ